MSEQRKGRRTPPPEPEGVDAEGAVPVVDAAAQDGATTEETGPPDPVAAAPAGAAEDAAVLKDRWLRAEAELQNFRRRAARDREESRRSAEESVMLEIIAALDDLERALATAPESGSPEPWAEGVRMVGRRLVEYLGRQGVAVVDPMGQPFDPAFHEAVLEMAVPGAPSGQVTQVLLRGWRRGTRALRAARVVVASAPEEGSA